MTYEEVHQSAAGVVYIAGAGHSGSSLLDAVLGSHAAISSTGEMHRLSLTPESRECSCGQVIVRCPRWSRVLQEVSAIVDRRVDWSKFPLSAGDEIHRMTDRGVADAALLTGSGGIIKATRLISASLERQLLASRNSWVTVEAIGRVEDVEWVVDSTKSAGRLGALAAVFPERLRVLHLVRDPRAVVASDLRRTGMTLRSATRRWLRANTLTELAMISIPSIQTMQVRYEDLCESPLEVANEVFAFLDLPSCGGLRLPQPSEIHAVPGNPMFLRRLDQISLDERWRGEMSAVDRRSVERLTWPLRRRYGYDE